MSYLADCVDYFIFDGANSLLSADLHFANIFTLKLSDGITDSCCNPVQYTRKCVRNLLCLVGVPVPLHCAQLVSFKEITGKYWYDLWINVSCMSTACNIMLAHGLVNTYTLRRSAACVLRSSKTVSTLHHCSAEMDLSGIHSHYERERENRERPMLKC